jgi:DNA-binding NtrC family response regulator
MSGPTALLLTQDASLAMEVGRIATNCRDLRIETCSDEDEAWLCLKRGDVGLAILHLTPASEAAVMQLLALKTGAGRSPVALVLGDPACAPCEAAVRQAGAADFLQLPSDLGRLAEVLDSLSQPAPTSAGRAAPSACDAALFDPFFGVVAPEMAELMEQLRRVAPQDTTLLFTGETGTGKTRLARLVHEFSPRREQPFLVVDCGALSPTLIESEMFGHVRGAFTGADRDRAGKLAAAGSGTLLLDEVNSLPLPLQSKLLRAVDERVFEPVGSNRPQLLKARLIAVSNAPLEKEVEAGRFRSDLYYRLNVVGFFLPPLRDRRAAVAPLAGQFAAEFAARNRPDVGGLSEAAVQALEGYGWPGNVRELRNVIERAVALCPGPQVEPRDLPEAVRAAAGAARGAAAASAKGDNGRVVPATTASEQPATLAQSREETEIRRIQEALHKHQNNRRRAAAELGISRMGLYKKLEKYKLM